MSSIYDEYNDMPVSLIDEIKELTKSMEQNDKKKVLNRVREEYKKAKDHAIKNGMSQEYFDNHYNFLYAENKSIRGKENLYIYYTYTIKDEDNKEHSVNLSVFSQDEKLYLESSRGFVGKEIENIISKKKAIEYLENSTECKKDTYDTKNYENKISLLWIGPTQTRDGIKYEYGYSWVIRGKNGTCDIDAETGNTEYTEFVYLTD